MPALDARPTIDAGIHPLLRFATAGSVDDGKSTLVGRLLHDTTSIPEDQLAAVAATSRDRGLAEADLALLTDGLRAEREQGITIDVAYRYFATPRRSFILADTPGHVQYTRNMVTGASTAELVLVLVDARHGVVEQTRRHAAVAALLGVRHLVLAVNKMDLVGFAESVYLRIFADFAEVARRLGIADVVAVPISALRGDNVVERSADLGWYTGPTLLEHLEEVPVGTDPFEEPFRFPVQYVIRPRTVGEPDYRGYAGRITSGVVRVGEEIVVQPAGRRSVIVGIETADGPLEWAKAGQSVSLRIAHDIDIARGDLIAPAASPAAVVRSLRGMVCVLGERPLGPGERLLVRSGTRTVRAVVEATGSRLDLASLDQVEHRGAFELNEIGEVELRLADPVACDPYARLRPTGAFLLIDEQDGATRAAGMVAGP